jgi:hypothetical protein
MVICNRCKKDPVSTETNEELKKQPWAIVVIPPPGGALPESRLCHRCWWEIFQSLLALAPPAGEAPKPN